MKKEGEANWCKAMVQSMLHTSSLRLASPGVQQQEEGGGALDCLMRQP